MPGARTRVISIPGTQGVCLEKWNGSPFYYNNQSWESANYSCSDTHGFTTVDNALTIVKYDRVVRPINGYLPSKVANPDKFNHTYSNWVPEGYYSKTPPMLELDIPSTNELAVMAFARTNPSRPVVDVATSIAELRDAPELLYKAGRSMLRNGANWWLAYNFGWKPLVNDVLDLMDIGDDIDKRVEELQRLDSKGGLKRRVQLASGQNKTLVEDTVSTTTGKVFTCKGAAYSNFEAWGTVRWRPDHSRAQMPKGSKGYRDQARRAVLGLTVDPSTAWNLMPWSWMIDWASNMSEYLVSTRNTVGATAGPVNIMVTRRDVLNLSDSQSHAPEVTGGGCFISRVSKTRSLEYFGLPELDLGAFITPQRLSILGSLAVTRIPRNLL